MRPGSTPKVDRIKRVNERILRELSMGLYRIGQGRDIDLARISFVDVRTSPDLHGAIVVVSVLGTEAEAEKAQPPPCSIWSADKPSACPFRTAWRFCPSHSVPCPCRPTVC